MIHHKLFDLNLLRVFAYVYMFRNITRAAERLHSTQPAVSRALAKLNDIYGERLFIHKHNQMVPSRLAEHIADNIFNALEQADRAVKLTTGFEVKKQAFDLKLGMNDYCINLLFPTLYRQFNALNNDITVSTVHCTYDDVIDKLENMSIDGAIVSQLPNSKRVDCTPIFTDDYVVIVRKDNKLNDTTLSLALFLQSKHTLVSYSGQHYGWVDARLAEKGLKREVACTIHLFSLLPEIVLELDVIATIPRRMAKLLASHYPISLYELPISNKIEQFYFVRPRYSADAAYREVILNTVLRSASMLP